MWRLVRLQGLKVPIPDHRLELDMRTVLAFAVLALPMALSAQRPPACASDQHRAFDYWVGEWNVVDTTGAKVAESGIERVAAGCAIRETWKPLQGPQGVSISWYEPADSMWHQQWVGGTGWNAWFDGGAEDGVMHLTTKSNPANPNATRFRMIYTQPRDNVVRQTLYVSNDDGATWAVNFVGDYVRKP
jgi:hypothetical protein